MQEEIIFANALNQCLLIGAASLKKIKNHFGSFKNGWLAPLDEIKQITGARKIPEFRKEIDPQKEFEILQKEGIKIILEENFLTALKEVPDHPQILYIKGDLPKDDEIHLAVVGTRRFSSYGKEVCEKIVEELKNYNIIIVSGLALGIDTIAHKTALKNKMKTIAVLGSGLRPDVIYPGANQRLAQEISENGGCLISEYPFSMKAAYFTFPQRNRIVAGLSQGTLVVEAPEKSGALITAFLALDYNRDVFSIPGPIFSLNSTGTNKLIKMGALAVTDSDDILHALGIEIQNEQKNQFLSLEEEKIISFLYDPLSRDELIQKTNALAKEINPLLSQMEIKGIIKEIDGKIYKL